MKKLGCVICLFLLLLSACSQPKPEVISGVYELHFSAKQISGDTVSDDWYFAYRYNGKIVGDGYQVYVSPEIFSFLVIEVDIIEHGAADNIRKGCLTVAACHGGSGKTEIEVTKEKGWYAGNTAVFEISCTVQAVTKK